MVFNIYLSKTLDCHNEGVLSLAHMFMLFKHYGYSISSNDL